LGCGKRLSRPGFESAKARAASKKKSYAGNLMGGNESDLTGKVLAIPREKTVVFGSSSGTLLTSMAKPGDRKWNQGKVEKLVTVGGQNE